MKITPISYRQPAGFTLVEIMVGIVIGMLGILVIMQMFALFEGQKRTSTTGSDAQTNGAFATFTAERDIRLAGFGMGLVEALGCEIHRAYNTQGPGGASPAVQTFRMVPVDITNGAGGAPDTIRILYSSKTTLSLPLTITTDHPAEAANFFVNSAMGIAEGDVMIVYDPYDPTKWCTQVEVSGIPTTNCYTSGNGTNTGTGCSQIHHNATPAFPWNWPGGHNIFPAGGYQKGSRIFNMGTFTDHTYSIAMDASSMEGSLRLTDFNNNTNANEIRDLAPGIVNLQVQYGKDTNNDQVVDQWDSVDPAATSGWRQIRAVRMAIVARSSQMEKEDVSDVLNAQGGTVTWSGSGDANAVLRIDRHPDGTANADWARYRYKVYETVIPLRNVIWPAI